MGLIVGRQISAGLQDRFRSAFGELKVIGPPDALFISRPLAGVVISRSASVVRPDASSLPVSAASPARSDSARADCSAPASADDLPRGDCSALVDSAQGEPAQADYSAPADDSLRGDCSALVDSARAELAQAG